MPPASTTIHHRSRVVRSFVAVFKRPTPRSQPAELWNLLEIAIPDQGVTAPVALWVVRRRLSSSFRILLAATET
jgi:hypothetical protein